MLSREVEHRWPGIDTRKFFMMGFSGGGQFAHRFLYLYPERLHAISVGAPGRVTQLDDILPWPSGVQNVEEKFAKKIEKDKIRAVGRIQLVVGSEDNTVHGGEEFWAWLEERQRHGSAKKMVEGNGLERMRTGRLQTLQNLQRSWLSDGIETQLDIVPGVAHNLEGVLDAVLKFFEPLIKNSHLG
jgi:poly(3-hydroxybutyrate) depolymerase